jgi:hypothetical protein
MVSLVVYCVLFKHHVLLCVLCVILLLYPFVLPLPPGQHLWGYPPQIGDPDVISNSIT